MANVDIQDASVEDESAQFEGDEDLNLETQG